MIELKENTLCSQSGIIKIIPMDVEPMPIGYSERGRVDMQCNATIGAGLMAFPTLFFAAGNPGYVRLIGDHKTLYVAMSNPETVTNEDGTKYMTAPPALGDLILNNLSLKGNLNVKLPVFETITSARKELSEHQFFVTPAGYVRQILPLANGS